MSAMVWTEDAIRAEFRRLDKKFGLDGASLPIIFNKARCTLGQFCGTVSGEPKCFRFSKVYFDDPKFPVKEALDTIRHEYAHYMEFMLYGKTGHGPRWKKCCIKVGAMPIRCYDKKIAAYRRERQEEQMILESLCDDILIGTEVEHPKFGKGIVTEIYGDGIGRQLHVEFASWGTKKIAASWAAEHCKMVQKKTA